ncbi:Trichome birefringence-like family [Vigna unguiculata]|uniref:Trichome birefringence-like family n=1 Tax=Vigna unguiculata TaxID=3917 RepID=A0A4D6MZQ1_VIGUN|nr:Trichome birefringence-like family [Vigna unguiculata]
MIRTTPFKSSETRLEGYNLELHTIQVQEFKCAEKKGVKRGLKFMLLDTTQAMLLRPDGHPNNYGHSPHQNLTNDCVHWCLPGPIDTLAYFLLETLRREGSWLPKGSFSNGGKFETKVYEISCGTYVEGYHLQNKYQWKDTIGPWEERPGHNNDIWNYWSDDGIGYLEYLQQSALTLHSCSSKVPILVVVLLDFRENEEIKERMSSSKGQSNVHMSEPPKSKLKLKLKSKEMKSETKMKSEAIETKTKMKSKPKMKMME